MSKVMTLKDAIAKYVHSGDHIALGGFTTDRKPYAAVYEILRQGITDLTGLGGAGGDWDMLIGNGRVKAYINCYTANSGVTNVSRRFRKWFEAGKLTMEDYSQDVIYMMWHAAALGLPFLPVTLMQGSGLTDEWGISKEVRKTLDKVPDDKFKYIDNPFKPGEKSRGCTGSADRCGHHPCAAGFSGWHRSHLGRQIPGCGYCRSC